MERSLNLVYNFGTENHHPAICSMAQKKQKNPDIFRKKIFSMAFFFLLTMPSSTDYKLKDYGFGSGGTGNSSSTDYSLKAVSGEQGGSPGSSENYNLNPGLIFTGQANVPGAPAFTNPANFYNKLKIVLDTANNPSDTKYAIAISTDNFVTTNYIQSDNTIGPTLGLEDYQTYSAWGGEDGFYVIGLASNTAYKIKTKAMQGKFTETGYGPASESATISPTLSFNISTVAINFGNLESGIVTDSPQNIAINFATNGESGGRVYVVGKNGGLRSLSKNYQINSVTGDLSSSAEGIGAQGVSATQDAGGPLSIVSPYNATNNNVGIVDSSVREIFVSANPLVGGQGVFMLKAKASSITPAASDYEEVLTITASGSF